MKSKVKYYLISDALKAMQKYCAMDEHCQQDVRQKLNDGGMWGDDAEEVIAALISEGFINEERYSIAFATGKLRINRWGKIKIKHHLKAKGISEYCIRKALNELQDEEYNQALQKVISTKIHKPVEELNFPERQKLYSFALSRGFEPEVIARVLKNEED